MKGKLTQEELKQKLHYDPVTGLFTWLVKNSSRGMVGNVAGYLRKDGYITITINNKKYLAHQLAWLYMEGYFPEFQIDHRLGVRNDNRWAELRHVTQSCNNQNQTLSKRNKSGFTGVHWKKHADKWMSEITINKKGIFLGYYSDVLEAALARFTAEMQCSLWTCNYRSELVKEILNIWPAFLSNMPCKL